MKFLHRVNRQYLWTFTFLLVILSIVGYYVLRAVLANEIKESINEKEYAIIHEIKARHNLPNIYPIVETKEIDSSMVLKKNYHKIYLIDKIEDEIEPYLEYKNTIQIDGTYYLITLRHSLLDNNDLIIAIALPLLFVLVFMFVGLFFLIKHMNKSLWVDFENNLSTIENFSLKDLNKLCLKKTGIEEFDRLNKTVVRFTDKIQSDYSSLKEFTENASHESQTPLAIIQSKLELLIQMPDINRTQVDIIKALNDSVSRLKNLNSGLLLLTKIDNRQFVEQCKVHLSELLLEKIASFEPVIQSKKIVLIHTIKKNSTINTNFSLVEILLNNLINNAIKHNVTNGKIVIELTPTYLLVINTGIPLEIEPVKLFERFQKASTNVNSIGLGLSISKKICETLNWSISYTNSGNEHVLKVDFQLQ